MTLIEVIIYSALLSMLLAGVMSFVWGIHMQNIILRADIIGAYHDEH